MRSSCLFALLSSPFLTLSALGDANEDAWKARWNDHHSEAAWKTAGIVAQTKKFEDVHLIPRLDDKSLVAADCVAETNWWSSLQVLRRQGDKVIWLAKIPPEYSENCGHYILSCKWLYLEKIGLWVLEIFDSTHMGNGSYWLLELKNRQLRVVMHARAVDNHLDHSFDGSQSDRSSQIFENGRLQAKYPIAPNGKFEGVHLSGIILGLDSHDKEMSRSPYSETWTWNPKTHVFDLKTEP